MLEQPTYTTIEMIQWISSCNDYDELHYMSLLISKERFLYCVIDLQAICAVRDWKQLKLSHVMASEDMGMDVKLGGELHKPPVVWIL